MFYNTDQIVSLIYGFVSDTLRVKKQPFVNAVQLISVFFLTPEIIWILPDSYHNTNTCVCVASPHHQQAILWHQFYNPTQFWHYIPRDSVRFHKLKFQSCKTALQPPTLQVPTPSPRGHLGVWQSRTIDWRFQQPPWFDWFATGLTGFRKPVYSLDCSFIMKRYNAGGANASEA